MSRNAATSATRSIRRLSLASFICMAAMLFGAGGWAAFANLSSAVIGVGSVAFEGSVKRVQHKEGGIVDEIRVREGARVAAGDVLVRLDATLPRASLALIVGQIDQLTARRQRLVAERDGEMELISNDKVQGWSESAKTYFSAEQSLFDARKRTLQGQKSQLRERIGEIGQEKQGLTVRLDAKIEELDWIEQELTRVRSLTDKGLVQFTRLSELQRLRAQAQGERGDFMTQIAQAATRVTETELQILQLDENRRSETLTELRDVENKLAELTQQRVAAEDALARIAILSPQTGIVHDLAVHTIGGIISPGETIMEIVPVNDKLVVETRLHPSDIDQVFQGQQGLLRFSAFNQRTTPAIMGIVTGVAADLTRNQQSGEAWYTARISIPDDEMKKLGNLPLVAGMPVEVFIQTGERSALSYLVKPFSDQMHRAMRED